MPDTPLTGRLYNIQHLAGGHRFCQPSLPPSASFHSTHLPPPFRDRRRRRPPSIADHTRRRGGGVRPTRDSGSSRLDHPREEDSEADYSLSLSLSAVEGPNIYRHTFSMPSYSHGRRFVDTRMGGTRRSRCFRSPRVSRTTVVVRRTSRAAAVYLAVDFVA